METCITLQNATNRKIVLVKFSRDWEHSLMMLVQVGNLCHKLQSRGFVTIH